MKRRNFLTLGGAVVAGILGSLLGVQIGKNIARTRTKSADTIGKNTTRRSVPQKRWKMVTSWPKDAPGTGKTAQRLADRISALTQGELNIDVYPAGSLVGPLEVFDAVRLGSAELGHTASLFWQGKAASAAYFTTVPFGLSPVAHHAWLQHGGGQTLWDELYADFNLLAFAAGNTGPSMGGWFKRPLAEDAENPLRGLRIRMPGLAGLVMRQVGALPVTLAPGEIFSALKGQLIDAAELLGPWHDRAYGLHKAARYYYHPGFHEPNGTAECLINRKAFDGLSKEHRLAIKTACLAENIVGLGESEHYNAIALRQLVTQDGVMLRTYSPSLLKRLKNATNDVLANLAKEGTIANAIYQSYRKAQQSATGWEALKLQ